jgi:hypothetical protein
MPAAHRQNVMNAWSNINPQAGRRFSVHVDATLEAGVPEAEVKIAREAATELLKLPWELLHDGDGYLFQGAKPTRVRRPCLAEPSPLRSSSRAPDANRLAASRSSTNTRTDLLPEGST